MNDDTLNFMVSVTDEPRADSNAIFEFESARSVPSPAMIDALFDSADFAPFPREMTTCVRLHRMIQGTIGKRHSHRLILATMRQPQSMMFVSPHSVTIASKRLHSIAC